MKSVIGIVFFLGFLTLGLTILPPIINDILYEPIDVDYGKNAKLPVIRLITNLKRNAPAYKLRNSFKNKNVFEKFSDHFQLESPTVDIFRQNIISYEIVDAHKTNPINNSEYNVKLRLTFDRNEDDTAIIDFTSTYEDNSKQYFISDLSLKGTVLYEPFVKKFSFDIPEVVESPCYPDNYIRFRKIKLRTRSSNGSVTNPEESVIDESFGLETVTEDAFFNSQVFEQVKFDKLVDKKKVPDPGYVLSVKDLREMKIKDADGNDADLFAHIQDAYGVLYLPDKNGDVVNYPTAAVVDRAWKRVMLLTSKNSGIINLDEFDVPVAVFISGQFMFVLDVGFEGIKIYKLIPYEIGFGIYVMIPELAGLTDFGLELRHAKDLTGFEAEDYHVLYISDPNVRQVHRILVDKSTGLLHQLENNVLTIREYKNPNNEIRRLPKISRFEVSPRTSDHNLMLAVDKSLNSVYSFNIGDLESDPYFSLISSTHFPESYGSKLSNIGYNVGEQAFYVTDFMAGKMHVFSNDGNYIGSGGRFGEGELDNELYYPGAVSSNTFSNDANEMVVANRWGYETGFKRIRPLAGVNNLAVFETAPYL